jgi:hypothetical protein
VIGDTVKKAGLVTVTNNYSQLATGAMDVQIGGTTVGSRYSQLNVTGPVTLGVTLGNFPSNSASRDLLPSSLIGTPCCFTIAAKDSISLSVAVDIRL